MYTMNLSTLALEPLLPIELNHLVNDYIYGENVCPLNVADLNRVKESLKVRTDIPEYYIMNCNYEISYPFGYGLNIDDDIMEQECNNYLNYHNLRYEDLSYTEIRDDLISEYYNSISKFFTFSARLGNK